MEDTTVLRESLGLGQEAVIAVTFMMLIFTVIFLRRARYALRLPPGPRGWPVVGSFLSLGKLPHQSLSHMSTRYGPLMLLYLGSRPAVVVSNSQMAKEFFKTYDQIMCSRPDRTISSYLTYDKKGLTFAPYGPHWRHIRKVCMLELFTAYRFNQFQGVRQGEVLAMVHSIFEESKEGNALQMNEVLSNLTTNIVTQMMWNKKYSGASKGFGGSRSDLSDQSESIVFREIIREMFELSGVFIVGDFIPSLKSLAVPLQGYGKRMENVHRRLDIFLDNIIDEHQKSKSSSHVEDFVDVLLKLSKNTKYEKPLSMESVKAILTELIGGGTETSATTTEWALAELVKHPSTMRKAQEELNSVVGPNRLVKEADVAELKYLQSVVKETLRMHAPGPLLVRESLSDCEVAGYHIPAKSLVLLNLWAIHRDGTVWARPLEFDPERFVNSTVDVRGQDFEFLPFGSGRRMCPAISLGLGVVQYSLAQLLHAFSWTLPPDQTVEELDMAESSGLTSPMAVSLRVLASPRLPTHVIFPTATASSAMS